MLKLGKLPDRTPVRIVITVSPDLNRDLVAYAEAYRQGVWIAWTDTDQKNGLHDSSLKCV